MRMLSKPASRSIEKHANLTETEAMLIRIHVNCGPFEGVEDFQEAFAGGGQVWIDEMASGKLTP